MRILALMLTALSSGPEILGDTGLAVPEYIDVGQVQLNEVRKFQLPVKNNSSKEVNIADIKSSCSCTNVGLTGNQTILAGAERVVTGNVNFGNALGHRETSVSISYRDGGGDSTKVVVPVRGKVVASIVLEKRHIDFGAMALESDRQIRTIEVKRGNADQLWDSIQLICKDEHVTAKLDDGEKSVWRISLHLDPAGLPISAFRSTVELKLSFQGKLLSEEIQIPVLARITGPMKATPTAVYLGARIPEETIDRSVAIFSSSLDLRELAILEKPAGIDAKITPSGASAAKLHLTVTIPSSAGPLSQTLALLHRPTGVRLSIPIIGIVKKPDVAKSQP